MRSITVLLHVVTVVMLGLAGVFPAGVARAGVREEAVFSGNWPAVVELLQQEEARARDPVARLLMAPAGLATNRNHAPLPSPHGALQAVEHTEGWR